MTTRDLVIEATRAFIREEVARDPGLTLLPDDPLISGGVLTSLDLVTVSAFLERRFEITVPESMVRREHLDSLEAIAALVLSRAGGASAADGAGPIDTRCRLLPGFRSPWIVAAATVLAFFAMDRLVGVFLARYGTAAGFYPADVSRMDYNFRDYEEALAHHALGRTPKGPDEIRIIGQGDSGTYGSYMAPDQACYGVAGELLEKRFPTSRLYNVSYFGQSLVKDASILEAELPYRPDIVVIAVSSYYFDRIVQEQHCYRPPTTIVYNRRLFQRFVDHAPGGKRREFRELDDVLAEAEARAGFDFLHTFEALSVVTRNQLVLRSRLLALTSILEVTLLQFPSMQTGRIEAAPIERTKLAAFQASRCFAGHTLKGMNANQQLSLDERVLAVLEAIIDRAHSAGAEVMLVWEPEALNAATPPNLYPWNEQSWRILDENVNEIVHRKGVTLVSGRALLPPEEFLDSDRHWTIDGNAILGRAIGEGLVPLVERVKNARALRCIPR